ncbi:LLM class flavin-dependent oxidoreductase [SAR202 cluster bacterium AC-647-N09_OGT_505m]|nr:LLM class flavin-dependent oxidoreductase [SAR202 cluster bacterium AC-647-N09_OGT_505m]
MDALEFGIVDQSPIRNGGTVQEALHETVVLARLAEKLGYHRYWVAEHHNSGGFAGTAPEILVGQIASQTHSITVGSGGVMLSHYSAFKVAETFSVLQSFYPNRIELGIGRAPGSDQDTARALSYPKEIADIQTFPQQVTDLIGFLSGTLPDEHIFSNIKSQPGPPPLSIPGIWLLGSSDYSARLAATLGLPFSFADFFGTTAGHGPLVADLYRQLFRPSGYLTSPKFNVALQVICAETSEEAEFIQSSRNISRINTLRGIRGPMISPEEAYSIKLAPSELHHLEQVNKHSIRGSPAIVKNQILEAAKVYRTTDVSIVTNCYYLEDRLKSFELISEAFDLPKKPQQQ